MTRIASKLGIAAALTLGMLSTAAAQTGRTTPPTTKVPTGKDQTAGGEVVTVHDTVTVTKYVTDTLRLPGRRDTIRLTGPTVTVTRWDTVTVTEAPGWMGRGNGTYFGFGAGSFYPMKGISGGQTAGYSVQMHAGIDPKGSPLGLRVSGLLTRPNEERPTTEAVRPTIMDLTAELKLRSPSIGGSGAFPAVSLYALGGGAWVRYQGLRTDNPDGTWRIQTGDPWQHKWAMQAGAGLAMSIGHKRELFLEGRGIRFQQIEGYQSPVQFPLVLGVNWY